MTDETHESDALTPEELERQQAEQLPAREAMSIISPEPPFGRIPDDSVPSADPGDIQSTNL